MPTNMVRTIRIVATLLSSVVCVLVFAACDPTGLSTPVTYSTPTTQAVVSLQVGPPTPYIPPTQVIIRGSFPTPQPSAVNPAPPKLSSSPPVTSQAVPQSYPTQANLESAPPPYIPTLSPGDLQNSQSFGLTPRPDDLQVHFINVGQGDAILILAPGGFVGLIDGGYGGMGTLEYLQAHGVKRVNVMVATHPHADHIGGLVNVLHAIPVDEVVTNGYPYTTQVYEDFIDAIAAAKARYREVHRGDTLTLGSLTFQVLSPSPDDHFDDLNQTSIVLRLVYGPTSFLFTGDAGDPAEDSMIKSGQPLQATILKVGHHGSHTSSSTQFLAKVQPKIAVYSAGMNNPYGHPHSSTLDSLARVHATIYGTDVNGTVIVTADPNGYSVATSKLQNPVDPYGPGPPTWTPTAQAESEYQVTVTVSPTPASTHVLNRRTATSEAKQTSSAEKTATTEAKRIATAGAKQTSVADRTATVATRRTATAAARQTATAQREATRSARLTATALPDSPPPVQTGQPDTLADELLAEVRCEQ